MNNKYLPTQRVLLILLACALLWISLAEPVKAANGPFNGRIAFVSGRDGSPDIFTMNANGTSQVNITNNPGIDNNPAWSPDGTKIAFESNRAGAFDIYVMNADGSNPLRLTFTVENRNPSWSPDGTKIAFESTRDGTTDEIYVMSADGTGQTRLTNNSASDFDSSWSPDGTKIAFVSLRDGGFEIYVMNSDGTGQTRLTNNTATEARPDFSPDGTKIVFDRAVNSLFQIFVMNVNGTGQAQLTSAAGWNLSPDFSPDGTKITFGSTRDGNNEIYTMDTDGSNQVRLTNNTPVSDTVPNWQPIPKLDTIGVFRPSTGQFLLRNFNTAGPPNITITFGQSGDQPLAGDWDGDGVDNVGVFRNGQFLLRQPRAIVNPITVNFGQAGDIAVVGDWNGDGIDTPGVFRPSTGQFLLTNGTNTNNSSPPASIVGLSGQAGDRPVAGDWNGDGIDTVGLYSPAPRCAFQLSDNNSTVSTTFQYFCVAPPSSTLTGDWNGDSVDTIGFYSASLAAFSLSNHNATPITSTEIKVSFGQSGDLPVAGDWNGGNTAPDSGVNSPADGSSQAGQTQVFTTTCSDSDGWHNIWTIDFLVAKSLGQGNGVPLALWVQFDENRNVIRFYDPDLQTWSEGVPGANVVLSSRFADLHLAQTTVTGSGPTGSSVQITWGVIFKHDAVNNNYKQYLQITDDAGLSTGFDKVGSWSVTGQ